MLYSAFSQALHNHRQSHSRVILALSGGVDSRVLLDLLIRYRVDNPQVECCAVHIHHGLSPNADVWLERCKQWCSRSGMPFFSHRVELEQRGSVSIEEVAREARYHALRSHVTDGDLLITGQHSGDQIETFLLALKRGSGPKGLSSMAQVMPFFDGLLIRPLLTQSRQNIESYAHSNQLSWNEDESNQDQRYDRNFLRHAVLPQLTKRWPTIEASVQRSAELCAEQQLLLSELLSEKLEACLHSDGSLLVKGLSAQSDIARNQLIRMWLELQGARMPSRKQLELIWHEVALSQPDANPKLMMKAGEIRRFQSRLYWVDAYQDLSLWQQPLAMNKACILPDGLGQLVLRKAESEAKFLLREPLEDEHTWVHFEPEGMSALPVGRDRSRKMKKLFQEYGVPSWQRKRQPILMYGDSIAAVGNLFVTRHCSGQECELIWYK